MVKAEVGGVAVEMWFTPSFNIKTTSKEVEQELRRASLRAYDPWQTRMREVKVTQGEREAYIFLTELKETIPALKVKLIEFPPLPEPPIDEKKEGLLY